MYVCDCRTPGNSVVYGKVFVVPCHCGHYIYVDVNLFLNLSLILRDPYSHLSMLQFYQLSTKIEHFLRNRSV